MTTDQKMNVLIAEAQRCLDDGRYDAVSRKLTALAALLADGGGLQSEWQPIETAPKDDGELLLLYPGRHWCEESDRGEVAYWDEDSQQWATCCDGAAEDYTGPTHWMPLPNPPAVSGGAVPPQDKPK